MGATIALLFAPASGEVTRRKIGQKAEEGRDAITETGKEFFGPRARPLRQRPQLADEAADMVERGRKVGARLIHPARLSRRERMVP